MSRYYLRSTIRNARKNSVLSFAKLFGLTLAFAVILFASGYVYYETSFDKFMPDYSRIYRCLMTGKLKNNAADFAVTSPAMAEAVVNDLPEIEEAVRFTTRGDALIYHEDKLIAGGTLAFADSNFFSFFGFPVEKANSNPLPSENSLAISRSIAENNFGSVEAALNTVVFFRGDECIITAVFDDMPRNCHLQIETIQQIGKMNPDQVGWYSQSYYTYIKTVSDKVNVEDLSFKITQTVYNHSDNQIDAENAQTWEDLKWDAANYLFYPAEPLKDIHFSQHRFDPAQTSNKTYVYGAVILAILVLIVSSLNYINLTIADLSTRFREIGIHKTAGAFSNQISLRFILESLLYWGVAFLLACIIYDIIGKSLADYLNFSIDLSGIMIVKIVLISFLGLLAFNILVNIIPITYITRKKVLSLVKEEKSGKYFSLKNSFILFQFIISVLIILSSLIVQKQITYIVEKDRGYNPENIIMLGLYDQEEEVRQLFMEELRKHAFITSVSSADISFGYDPGMNSAHFDNTDQENYFHTSVFGVDHDFLNTFEIELVEGRNFQKGRKLDENAILINEAVLKEYAKGDNLIGNKIFLGGNNPYTVIGIVKDFNYRSLHHPLLPLVIRLVENSGAIFIRTQKSQIAETIKLLDKTWAEFEINRPLEYEFHDDIVVSHYEKDQQAKKLLLILSIISITIACIGLYAISFFIIVRKTKEIGIRKVNGAGISNVVMMLNISFTKWIVFAYLIATPIAWVIMKKWLENFAYKTALSWWVFALAGGLALGVAILTLIWQSWRAAIRNPVEALRYE